MKITCHSCAAKYTVSDEKVQGKTVKMKCRKCGATIVVGGSATPGEGAAVGDDAGVDLPAGSYLVNVTEGDQRTMQLAEIIDAYNQGVVTGDTYVWADGMADWQALSENEAIVAALNAAAGGAAPAAAAYGGTNGTNGNHTYEAPAPYAAPAAAGYGGADVFGGTPAFAASEAARPAAARKDAGRKSGDLFGGGGGGYDAGAGAAAAAISSPGNTGKRDENSVLFSLSALTQTSGPPSRPAGATTATKEDSGLIDLKALAASATPAPAAAPAAPAIDAVGLFPLGAPVVAPPPAQMQMVGPASIAPPQKRSPLPLILGGIVALAAIVGVFFVVRGAGEQTPTATAAAAAQPPPTATATETAAAATAEPTSEPTADATADASASASAAPIAAKGGGYKGGGYKGGTKGGTTAAPPSTGGSKPPPAGGGAKGPCSHCGSDLHCAMKCSAGKK